LKPARTEFGDKNAISKPEFQDVRPLLRTKFLRTTLLLLGSYERAHSPDFQVPGFLAAGIAAGIKKTQVKDSPLYRKSPLQGRRLYRQPGESGPGAHLPGAVESEGAGPYWSTPAAPMLAPGKKELPMGVPFSPDRFFPEDRPSGGPPGLHRVIGKPLPWKSWKSPTLASGFPFRPRPGGCSPGHP